MSSTETAEEVDSSVELSPPRRRFKKRHLSVEVKIILNVYKHELEDSADVTINEIVQKVADKVGTCRASVFNVLKEYQDSHSFSEPRTNQNRTSLIELVNDADRHAFRRKVHEFFFRNEIPSIDKVLRVVNEDPDLPTFKWQKRGRNSALVDRNEIILWRREYLTEIKNYRSQNRKIYFLDETWINAGHTKAKVWMDQSVTSARRAFLDGLSTGLKGPTGDWQPADATLYENSWRGAEAYHYYMMAQRYLYSGKLHDALCVSYKLQDYVDCIPEKDIYSLLALTACLDRSFDICSRALIRLKSLKNNSAEEQENCKKLAWDIFRLNEPTNVKEKHAKCDSCDGLVPDWSTSCPHCGVHFPSCIASGRSIIGEQIWICKDCRHASLKSKMHFQNNCPLCHAKI